MKILNNLILSILLFGTNTLESFAGGATAGAVVGSRAKVKKSMYELDIKFKDDKNPKMYFSKLGTNCIYRYSLENSWTHILEDENCDGKLDKAEYYLRSSAIPEKTYNSTNMPLDYYRLFEELRFRLNPERNGDEALEKKGVKNE